MAWENHVKNEKLIDELVTEFLSAVEDIEADDLRELKLNGDFHKVCEVLKKYGLCPYETERPTV